MTYVNVLRHTRSGIILMANIDLCLEMTYGRSSPEAHAQATLLLLLY